MIDQLFGCLSSACQFDKTLTAYGLGYQVLAVVATVVVLYLVSKKKKRVWAYYALMYLGCFLFEFLISPMSHYEHLGQFSYLYRGISWVMIMGWTTIIFTGVNLVDYVFPRLFKINFKEWQKYLITVIGLGVFLLLLEQLTVGVLSVRAFSPETVRAFGDHIFAGSSLSWLNLGWTIVLVALMTSFYKFLSFCLEKRVFIPMKNTHLLRNFIIAFVGIFMFELMIESMVDNSGFPAWSYIFADVSLITILSWTAIIALSNWLVYKFLVHRSELFRYLTTVSLAAVLLVPLEVFWMLNGNRVYSESTVANTSGLLVPGTNWPIELLIAPLLYWAIVVAFIKYWAIIIDNKVELTPTKTLPKAKRGQRRRSKK
jgi:hypothetical protein